MSVTLIHRRRAGLQPHLFAGVGQIYDSRLAHQGVNIKALKLLNLLSWHGYCIAFRLQASEVIEEANNKKVRIEE